MLTAYYYSDLYNKQTQYHPESEYQYFLRMARELKQTRIADKHAAPRKQQLTSLLRAVAKRLKAKRTPNLESLSGY